MEAPAGRGAERKVRTTVPSPTVWPASTASTKSFNTSRMAHHAQQLLEALHRMAPYKSVNVRQDGPDSLLHGFVPVFSPVRIGPDDAPGHMVQPFRLPRQQVRAAALPAVAGDDHDGGPRHRALAPPIVECAQHLSEPGAPLPVGD